MCIYIILYSQLVNFEEFGMLYYYSIYKRGFFKFSLFIFSLLFIFIFIINKACLSTYLVLSFSFCLLTLLTPYVIF